MLYPTELRGPAARQRQVLVQQKRRLQEARRDSHAGAHEASAWMPVAFLAALAAVAATGRAGIGCRTCLETVSQATVSRGDRCPFAAALTDGRSLRLAGIEPFAVLTSDPERMEAGIAEPAQRARRES